jgi:hypothetical protein
MVCHTRHTGSARAASSRPRQARALAACVLTLQASCAHALNQAEQSSTASDAVAQQQLSAATGGSACRGGGACASALAAAVLAVIALTAALAVCLRGGTTVKDEGVTRDAQASAGTDASGKGAGAGGSTGACRHVPFTRAALNPQHICRGLMHIRFSLITLAFNTGARLL